MRVRNECAVLKRRLTWRHGVPVKFDTVDQRQHVNWSASQRLLQPQHFQETPPTAEHGHIHFIIIIIILTTMSYNWLIG